MSKKTPIESQIAKAVDAVDVPETPKEQPVLQNLEPNTKYEGYLFVRENRKVEFFPKQHRKHSGMVTTETNDDFTVQESEKKVKITISFCKEGLIFGKVLKVAGKMIKQLQDMKIV